MKSITLMDPEDSSSSLPAGKEVCSRMNATTTIDEKKKRKRARQRGWSSGKRSLILGPEIPDIERDNKLSSNSSTLILQRGGGGGEGKINIIGREKVDDEFVDEEAIFNMPLLVDCMAEGMLLTPPALKKGFTWTQHEHDDQYNHVDLTLWKH